MKLSDLFEGVINFPNHPLIINIGTHWEPEIGKGTHPIIGSSFPGTGDVTGWKSVDYVDEDHFYNLINTLLPVKGGDWEDEDIARQLAIINDENDRNAIVLLKDGTIAFEDTLGDRHRTAHPESPQRFMKSLRNGLE